MPSKTYHIKGTLLDPASKKGIEGLTVVALDKDLHDDDYLGSAITNAEGQFELEFDEGQFKGLFDRYPDLYFKVFKGEVEWQTNQEGVRKNVRERQLTVQLAAYPGGSESTRTTSTTSEGEYRVIGRITEADGTPVVGAQVDVVEKKLRSENVLAQATTNDEGDYEASYTNPVPDGGPDLVVIALENKEAIAQSPVIYNAAREEVVDLVAGDEEYVGPSEFNALHTGVDSHLDGLHPAALDENDIEFLVPKTGAEAAHLEHYSKAHAFAAEVTADPALYYGLLRAGHSPSLTGLATLPAFRIRQSLEQSAADNIINAKSLEGIEGFIHELSKTAVRGLLSTPMAETTTTLNALLGDVLTDNERSALAQAHFDHRGSTPDFWAQVRADNLLGSDEKVKEVQFTLQSGMLTGYHLPLVRHLKEATKEPTLRTFAGWSAKDWADTIAQGSLGVPDYVEGDTEEDRLNNYAEQLEESLERSFPTTKFATLLLANDNYTGTPVSEFFTTVLPTEFDLATTSIPTYVAELDLQVKDPDQLVADLQGLQRVYRITPPLGKFDAVDTLITAGLDSSTALTQVGKGTFIKKYADTLGSEEEAILTFDRAAHVVAVTQFVMLDTKNGSGLLSGVVRAQERSENPAFQETIPDLETLFGSQDYCECEHCRSVYGPAAYLVDLLEFLRRILVLDEMGEPVTWTDSTGTPILDADGREQDKTALHVLLERRPDLEDIELSCANTNTPMPYVDLVNEILENAVLLADDPDATDLMSGSYQTSGTEAELKANPEHINRAAYNLLGEQVYPFSLPLNFWNEEAAIYLSHLGVDRHLLMDKYRFMGNGQEPTELDIACVRMGISQTDMQLLTGSTEVNGVTYTVRDFWGMGPGNWMERLAGAEKFLEKSNLEYTDLLRLLQVDHVNPNDIYVSFAEAASDCSLEGAKLKKPDGSDPDLGFYRKAYRFLRYQIKTGWTILEADKTMRAFGIEEVTHDLINKTGYVLWLQERTNVKLVELLSWWGDLDTTIDTTLDDDQSFYEQLFVNKSVLAPETVDADDYVFRLNADRTGLENTGNLVSGYITELAAVLNLSSSDISTLATELVDGEDTEITLASLSELHRKASICDALNLDVDEYLSLRRLITQNPYDSPGAAKVFVAYVERLRESGFEVQDLDYLLRHTYEASSGVAPTEDSIAVVLAELQSGLLKIEEENAFTSDPTGELTQSKLAVLFAEDVLTDAIAIIEGTYESDETGTGPEDFITEYFVFLDPDDAIAQLVDTSALTELQQRYEYVLEELLAFLKTTQSESYVIQTIASALGLDVSVAEPLLTELVNSPASTGRLAIEEFLDEEFLYLTPVDEDGEELDSLTPDVVPELFDTYILLHKISIIVNIFGITYDEIDWIFGHAGEVGWIELNDLPLEETENGRTLFRAWLKMSKLFELRNNFASGDFTLFGILDAAHNPDDYVHVTDEDTVSAMVTAYPDLSEDFVRYLLAVCAYTDWDIEDLAFFCSEQAYGFTIDDFKDEQALFLLNECMDILHTLGTSAADTWNWLARDLDSEQSAKVKQSAKAKYSTSEWLNVAQPLRDELREKQRKALVAYMLTQPDFEEEVHLFDHYLIDVEMSPCMITSRIKQANSSIQLFVQRCLLNLESEVALSDDQAEEWVWMKQYRVWEANRKVFLYPENWIEPELRDTKSEFFETLEQELLQNEVTEDTARDAILGYLEKLDSVADLEVMGVYHQYEKTDSNEDDIDIQHVIGRTRATPNRYYYRQFVNQTHWTPWSSIDLDIVGDLVIPMVYQRRMFLYWGILRENKDNQNEGDPQEFYDIQLAWSEYKNGRWQPKQIAEDAIISANPGFKVADPEHVFARTKIDSDDHLVIEFCAEGIGLTEWEYVKFTVKGPHGEVVVDTSIHDLVESVDIVKPAYTGVRNNYFDEASSTTPGQTLELPIGALDVDGNFTGTTPGFLTTLAYTPKKSANFRISYPLNYNWFVSQNDFFYQDGFKSFHVNPRKRPLTYDATWHLDDDDSTDITGGFQIEGIAEVDPVAGPSSFDDVTTTMQKSSGQGGSRQVQQVGTESYGSYVFYETTYDFNVFYHPYSGEFITALNKDGLEGFLNRNTQQWNADYFEYNYGPEVLTDNVVNREYPKDEVDFSSAGAYSCYNWELFFHIPLLIADRLSQNQQFEDAQKWLHFIFNPTDTSGVGGAKRYWQCKPFYEEASKDSIQSLMLLLAQSAAGETLTDEEQSTVDNLQEQIEAWRNDPFDPHTIAALRTTAYMKTTVMKYLDNLIAWGDSLFARDTIESINEATQLYLLAWQILGDKPVMLPSHQSEDMTYADLKDDLDEFSNALVEIENIYYNPEYAGSGSSEEQYIKQLYFCIPHNGKLLSYWETVADRLFKIRNCMNIEGVVRSLSLFEPAIDPALLVKAAASGIDLGSVLSDLYAPTPHYRFRTMLQKAVEFCNDVKGLGNSLLSALEKKDAEELALLRSANEIDLLKANRDIKELQLDEAKTNLKGLEKTKAMTEVRYNYYSGLDKLNKQEKLQLTLNGVINGMQAGAAAYHLIAMVSHLIPEVTASFPPAVTFGGQNVGQSAKEFGSSFHSLIAYMQGQAATAGIKGGHDRRWEDWKLQEELASIELEQLDEQIAANEIRIQVLEKELSNHDKQVEQLQSVDDYMNDKFTNKALYSWMVSQISTVYFQSYQLAYDLAKRAEKAFQFELGSDKSFIEFGYWDSLKKGLLSGDKLQYDLRRMDNAFLDLNKRKFELTKTVSVAQTDPKALVLLKQTGECYLNLPETLFDLDHPGHYFRRITSVSVTIPCVAGPYTNVSCTLTQLSSRWRAENSLTTPVDASTHYAEEIEESNSDSRFTYVTGTAQSIATSRAQGDSGLFQLNFGDERYLPFEGSGAISQWKLQLPTEFRTFDYNSISDVILQINYTAKDGGESFKAQVNHELSDNLHAVIHASGNTGLTRLFSCKHDFSNDWYRFLNPGEGADHTMDLAIEQGRFPYAWRNEGLNINQVDLFLLTTGDDPAFSITHDSKDGDAELSALEGAEGVLMGTVYNTPDEGADPEDPRTNLTGSAGTWSFAADSVNKELVTDLYILVSYDW